MSNYQENMESSETVEMFFHTSKYLKFLISELNQLPLEQIPYGVQQITSELIEALEMFSKNHSHDIKFENPELDSGKELQPSHNSTVKRKEFSANEELLNDSIPSKEKYYIAEPNVKDSNFYITAKFRHLLELVLVSPEKQHHYYCRTCNIVIDFIEEWRKHLTTDKKHITITSNKNYRNEELTCTICKITVFGSKPLMQKYMQYHTVIHYSQDSNERSTNYRNFKSTPIVTNTMNFRDRYSPVSPNFKNYPPSESGRILKERRGLNKNDISDERCLNSNYGSNSSLSVSLDSINSGRYINEKKDKALIKPCSPSSSRSSVIDFNDQVASITVSPRLTPVSITPNPTLPPLPVQNVSPLYKLLESMRNSYLSTKMQPVGSFCTLCNKAFASLFDWIDHLDSEIHVKNIAIDNNADEISCSKCGLVLFGPKVIVSQLMSSVEHSDLDKDMN